MQHRRPRREIRDEFAARRKRQIRIAVACVAAAVLALVWNEAGWGLPSGSQIPVWGAIVLAAAGLLYSRVNWRCPACQVYLGRTISPPECGGCGTRLH